MLVAIRLGALDFWSESPSPSLIEKLVRTMTPEELAAQVLVVGYPGEIPPEWLLAIAERHGLGGIKIFGWNANQLTRLTEAISSLQRAASRSQRRVPLFIATDQEGGWVRHVRFNTSQTSGNMAIGATGLTYDAYQTGLYIGSELRALGINFNFAPTVDLAINPEAHVIGSRAFSADPVQTAILGVAFYKGLEQAGVIATAKHYPGHGRTAEDSHGRLPRIEVDWPQLLETDLLPYQYLIRENIPAIMSGHLAFPRLAGSDEPASLSPFFAEEVLRRRLGFDNVLITDDLFMEGARVQQRNLHRVAERALRAGNDLILISQPREEIEATLQHFIDLARQDRAFQRRLQQAVGRVLKIKLRYLRGPNPVPLFPNAAAAARQVPAPGAREYFFQQAARSVTALRPQTLPWPQRAGRILVVTPYPQLSNALRQRLGGGVDVIEYAYSPFYGHDPAVAARLHQVASSYERILFNLVTPGSLGLLSVLRPWAERVTVLSQLSPTPLLQAPWVTSALAVWGQAPENIQAGVAALMGDIRPLGRSPVPVDP